MLFFRDSSDIPYVRHCIWRCWTWFHWGIFRWCFIYCHFFYISCTVTVRIPFVSIFASLSGSLWRKLATSDGDLSKYTHALLKCTSRWQNITESMMTWVVTPNRGLGLAPMSPWIWNKGGNCLTYQSIMLYADEYLSVVCGQASGAI